MSDPSLECTAGYVYFKSAASRDTECESFKLRLEFERNRLQPWGAWTFSDRSRVSAQQFNRKMKVHRTVIITLLTEMRTLLDVLEALSIRHETTKAKHKDNASTGCRSRDLGQPLPSEVGNNVHEADNREGLDEVETDDEGPLTKVEYNTYNANLESRQSTSSPSKPRHRLQSLARFGGSTLETATQPKRWRWAVRDKAKFRDGLDRLKELTDYLHETLGEDQMKVLLEHSFAIGLAVLQLTRTVNDMHALQMASQKPLPPSAARFDLSSTLGGPTLVAGTSEKIGSNTPPNVEESRFKAPTRASSILDYKPAP